MQATGQPADGGKQMPCDQVIATPVVFEKLAHKVEHIDLLAAGLKELGYVIVNRTGGFNIHNRSFGGRESTGTYIKGVFNVPERWSLDLNRVKQAYSAQVVMSQAKRFGWNLTRKSATEFEVMRRS
jgi:hypothetical protein